MNKNTKIAMFIMAIFLACMIYIADGLTNLNDYKEDKIQDNVNQNSNTLKIISSSENEDLEKNLKKFAYSQNIDLDIEYAGTLEIMEKLNNGEYYDAVWASNAIWLYMLNDSIKISDSKSTSINPVVFAVKESKAIELGFTNREIYTYEIVDAIKSGKLKFSMPNPTQTNTGATAYLGLLSTLAGNPEVLTEEHLQDETIKNNLISLFSGLERTSGSEDFLEELFLNGEYEAVVTYESSIINMNKQLEKSGRDTLYVLYPIDGVSISDSPLAYIDNGNDYKKDLFLQIRDYILSDEGQGELAAKGRRTWFGGVSNTADKTVFNPDWGIDTTRYIVPINFPNTAIIQNALALYQSELRKPVHIVFGLDYSGSMLQGNGYESLVEAMNYILNQEEAKKNFLQFTEKDKIAVIPFSTYVIDVWKTDNGTQTRELLNEISSLMPTGSTNIYDTSIEALDILKYEDLNIYNASIVLMTDGQSNKGSYSDFKNHYKDLKLDIPIYSITFGNAIDDELEDIAELTNGKVFNGKNDLVKAFKEVRGYN